MYGLFRLQKKKDDKTPDLVCCATVTVIWRILSLNNLNPYRPRMGVSRDEENNLLHYSAVFGFAHLLRR